MAYDAGMLTAVAREIDDFCRGGARVDKVWMPAANEVVLLLHAGRENRRLTCSASPSAARLTFTSAAKENPLTPPAFCMLLRKYLLGAALTRVRQEGYERVARLCFSARDEMGYEAGLYLVCEIMGKYSNLMLLAKDDRILGVLRPVDFTTSRLRQVLPGMTYELPPPQAKEDPRAETVERFADRMRAADPAQNAVRYLTDTYLGTCAQVARQIVYTAAGDVDLPLGRLRPLLLAEAFCGHHRRLLDGDVTPTLVTTPD
ncbi:MAG: NFACT family protein, partial [Clostridia bacterium]|nr:NFACT family protein [Clostridia bacterium]